jgi:hypothetical protein
LGAFQAKAAIEEAKKKPPEGGFFTSDMAGHQMKSC